MILVHEMALLSNVVDIVLKEVEDKDIARVTAVHLTVGELMDVIEEMVPGLFKFLARDTVAQDAEVIIHHVPAYVQCHACQEAWEIRIHDESTWTCPRCGAQRNYRLVSGREFRIDSLEVLAN